MKSKFIVGIVLFVMFFSSLSFFAFTSWAEGTASDQVNDLVIELRDIYEKALAARAASPDFLQDLASLIVRFEGVVSGPSVNIASRANLMSEAVDVLVTNGFPGKAEELGRVFYVLVKGSDSGRIWGTGVYTADTGLGTAAVHAGVLKAGQAGIVAVRTIKGQNSYEGSTRNGVTSNSYGSWGLSYEFVNIDEERLLIQDPGNMYSYGDLVGRSFAFLVTGDTSRGVWGTGTYTADSHLATAAVHAGILRQGETGVVLVEFLPGQDSYQGSSNFGVSSSSYSRYSHSYRLRKVQL